MMKVNYHTHTFFCDGKTSPEAMVRGAVERGFDVLGFSVHAPMKNSPGWTIDPSRLPEYLAEIRRLQAKYQGVITIRNGIELDRDFCDVALSEFEYALGAVHQIDCGGRFYEVDNTADILRDCCAREFGGDWLKLAERYYEELSDFILDFDVQIVAHYDLIEKFNAKKALFDSDDPQYQTIALRHLDRILDKKPDMIFEVNTGAMFRLGNPLPYPAPFLLRHLMDRQANLIVSSDAHCPEALDFAFDETAKLLNGYKNIKEMF